MSASTDPSRPGHVDACPWRPAGLLYLAALLAGLAAGLWPETIWPALADADSAPLPTLQTLALAQLAFVLLVYPMVLLRRFGGDTPDDQPSARAYWRAVTAESGLLTLLAIPFILPAAFLANATVTDVIRHLICLSAFWPLAWLAGAHYARRRRGAWMVTGGLLLIALGAPAACYVATEFLTASAADLAGTMTPALLVWRNAASRIETLGPQPLWAWLVWPVVAALAVIGGMIFPPKNG